MNSIQALREQRQQLAAELRNLMDSTAEKAWSDENQKQYDSIVAKVDDVDGQIGRIEKALEIENKADARVENRAGQQGVSADQANEQIETEKSVFNTWMREGKEGLNAKQREFVQNRINNTMSTGTGSQGGFLVPTDFAATLMEELKAFGGVRSVANIVSTSTGNPMQWPTVDETSNEGEIVAENAAVTSQDIAFGNKTLAAFKYSSKSIAIPFELLQDNNVDLESYVIRALAERIARITNRHFTVGTGSAQPQGIVVGAGSGPAAASSSAISYDDLVKLEHSVDPAYRAQGANYMFNDSTLLSLKLLKDSQGRPLWNPSLTAGEPDRIGRYGYTINQHMDSIGTGNDSVLFGNFRNYMIRDVMDVTMFRMADSKYIENGQIGFLAFSRHDAKLMDVSGQTIKKLSHA